MAVELHRERARPRRGLGAEAAKQRAQPLELVGRLGHDLDGRLADLRLQLRRRALGDDPAVVDDPDAVGEHVGLLEVLRREEDGHALLAREPPDLVPERGAALRVEAGRRLVEEEDRRVVDQCEREVEPALHAARVGAHFAVAGARRARRGRGAGRSGACARRRGCRAGRPGGAGARRRSGTGRARLPAARPRSTRAPAGPASRRRTRPRSRGRRRAGGGWSACGRSSTCRRRSGQGSRRSRPGRTRRSIPATASMSLNCRRSPIASIPSSLRLTV